MTGRGQPPNPRELRRQTLPRRALSRQEAAAYVGIGEKLFTRLVRIGRAPPAKLITTGRSTLERWTVDDLDQFIDALPSRDTDGRQTPAPRKLLSF